MNYKFFNKTLSFLTGGVIVFNLCGCSNKKESSSIDIDSSTTTDIVTSCVTTTITTVKSTTTLITTTTSEPITSTIPTTQEVTSINNDEIVLNQFNELGSDIHNSFDTSDLLEKGKMYFIYCVDFLFYDKEDYVILDSKKSLAFNSIILN